MNRQKIIPLSSIVIISTLVTLFFIDTSSTEKDELSEIFFIEGIFYESNNYVEIHFIDRSENTSNVVLEILGMEESFQKIYENSNEFIEIVPFVETPKYGWKIHPITLVIEHNEYGIVHVKTEIHSIDEPIPPVIYGKS